MKTKFFFGSFLIAGAALLLSCNSMAEFPELPKPEEIEGQVQPSQGHFCIYSDTKQCFPFPFSDDYAKCPGKGGVPGNKCPFSSSSAKQQSSSGGSQQAKSSSSGGSGSSSSGGSAGSSSSGGSQARSSSSVPSSSSVVPSSSSIPNCAGFAEGTTVTHQGKLKFQFCDVRDNEKYAYVVIGAQTWMAQNLNYNTGDRSSICHLGDDLNCKTYGRLYTWDAAKNNADPICPAGWSLPTDEQWQILVDKVAEEARDLQTTSGWQDNGNGKDSWGFSALPGGYSDGLYSRDLKKAAYWWSGTQTNAIEAWARNIEYNYSQIFRGADEKTRMYSVRCIQNK